VGPFGVCEYLDKFLIIHQAHLQRVMRDYVECFNTARPHQGIEQQIPIPDTDRKPPVRYAVAMSSVGISTTAIATLHRGKSGHIRVFLRVRVLQLDPFAQHFTVLSRGQVVKQVPLKGLHSEIKAFDDYLRMMCDEAVSESRLWLRHAHRKVTM
jgi:hypothetical protein